MACIRQSLHVAGKLVFDKAALTGVFKYQDCRSACGIENMTSCVTMGAKRLFQSASGIQDLPAAGSLPYKEFPTPRLE